MMKIQVRELCADQWPALEQLFGAKGACGGCWCMYWRVPQGERFEDIQGEEAKRRMRKLVMAGKARGLLAFDGETPVGWCAYGPRRDFERLDRAPSLACQDADRVWSLPCFFIKPSHRAKGVAGTLLRHALRSLDRAGAEVAEGYPVRPKEKGQRIPGAFAWTGTRSMFDELGFQVVGNRGGGKERVRKNLKAKAVR